MALNNPKDPTAHTTIALLATRELVEAAARTGRLDGMEPYVARLERWAAWDQRMFTLLVARRCRALISQGDQAERHYQAALATDGIGELPYELALTELLYGEWLRRARRRLDARTRVQSTLHQLTSQELEVARLAAQGLTNRQIADQLFLSTTRSATTSARSTPSSASLPAPS